MPPQALIHSVTLRLSPISLLDGEKWIRVDEMKVQIRDLTKDSTC
jgi:hypothetical protein